MTNFVRTANSKRKSRDCPLLSAICVWLVEGLTIESNSYIWGVVALLYVSLFIPLFSFFFFSRCSKVGFVRHASRYFLPFALIIMRSWVLVVLTWSTRAALLLLLDSLPCRFIPCRSLFFPYCVYFSTLFLPLKAFWVCSFFFFISSGFRSVFAVLFQTLFALLRKQFPPRFTFYIFSLFFSFFPLFSFPSLPARRFQVPFNFNSIQKRSLKSPLLTALSRFRSWIDLVFHLAIIPIPPEAILLPAFASASLLTRPLLVESISFYFSLFPF